MLCTALFVCVRDIDTHICVYVCVHTLIYTICNNNVCVCCESEHTELVRLAAEHSAIYEQRSQVSSRIPYKLHCEEHKTTSNKAPKNPQRQPKPPHVTTELSKIYDDNDGGPVQSRGDTFLTVRVSFFCDANNFQQTHTHTQCKCVVVGVLPLLLSSTSLLAVGTCCA